MALVDLFCFLLFCHLVLILSAGYGNGHQGCPDSFTCGNLGTLHYPFTKAELPHCGLLAIRDCDNPLQHRKTIQLEKNGNSSSIVVNGITQQGAISILDEDFHKRLQENTCGALKNNYSLPSPSSLYSIHIKYNVTLFKCKHGLNMKPPAHYFKYQCPDYDIYYDSFPSPNNKEAHSLIFSSCSVIQISSKDLTDTTNIRSFLSAEMVLEVVLSNDCDKCYNHRGGQCRLDSNQKFYCEEVSFLDQMIAAQATQGTPAKPRGPSENQVTSVTTYNQLHMGKRTIVTENISIFSLPRQRKSVITNILESLLAGHD